MITVLLTAFEPFGGDTENAAALVSAGLAENGAGYRIEKRTLPTEFVAGAQALSKAIDETQPQLVLCLGQAGDRSEVTPERIAVNLMDARIPDNAGWQPDEEPVMPDGLSAHFTNIPIKAVVRTAREAGYPVSVSNSAGTYVCNCVFYTLMNRIAATPANEVTHPLWGDFIHVPYVREQEHVPAGKAALPLKQAVGTVRFLLEEIVRRMEEEKLWPEVG